MPYNRPYQLALGIPKERRLPYHLLLDRYRARLERERNPDKRENMETIIAILLSVIETQEKLDDLLKLVQKLAP